LTGVLGLKPLGFATIEGFVNGLPLKLLLMGLPSSEFLELKLARLEIVGVEEDLFEGAAMDFSDNSNGSPVIVQKTREKEKKKSVDCSKKGKVS
jgi:hypothetical protein